MTAEIIPIRAELIEAFHRALDDILMMAIADVDRWAAPAGTA